MVAVNALFFLLSVKNLISHYSDRIAPDERVIFFPTSGSQVNATHWKVPIHGWIFEPEEYSTKRIVFLSLMRRALRVPKDSSEKRVLKDRLRPFVVDNARWKRPTIVLAGKQYQMKPSGKNGHFRTTLILSEDEIIGQAATTCNGGGIPKRLSYYAQSSDCERRFEGWVDMVPPKGVTILSDIDDTIKITNVVDKKAMLQNTFMKHMQAVPGMAKLYQKWCCSGDGDVRLHLLSASLYHLYEPLEAFRKREGFPPAVFSLRTIRPKNVAQTIQVLTEDAFEYKRRSLLRLFQEYPQRTFILVGDTGEKDTQIYASMERDFPSQVSKIFLRRVSKGPTDDVEERVETLLKATPREKWLLFDDASDLEHVSVG